jgi:hypothetical protein
LLYVPKGLPEPNSHGYTEAVVKAAFPLLKASHGRAFFLCTSLRAMRRTHELLGEQLERAGLDLPLLLQGERSKNELLERFRRLGNAILIGSQSFWEGVDVRGEALSLVVIDKLPFAPPDDPVLSARIERMKSAGRNAFMEYQLPRTVINVKQGAGRLIRDESDRGVLMICDPRLISKPYGKRIWRSLPPMKRSRDVEEALAFFASPAVPEQLMAAPLPPASAAAADLPADCAAAAEWLNRGCACISVDHPSLKRALEEGQGSVSHAELLATRPHLFSDSVVFVSEAHLLRMAQTIAALERVLRLPAYRERVLAYAPAIARHSPAAAGVFLGYDFHLGPDGPQLIEINSNAGGALLNARLLRAQRACCAPVAKMMPAPRPLEAAFVACFARSGGWREESLRGRTAADAHRDRRHPPPRAVSGARVRALPRVVRSARHRDDGRRPGRAGL